MVIFQTQLHIIFHHIYSKCFLNYIEIIWDNALERWEETNPKMGFLAFIRGQDNLISLVISGNSFGLVLFIIN